MAMPVPTESTKAEKGALLSMDVEGSMQQQLQQHQQQQHQPCMLAWTGKLAAGMIVAVLALVAFLSTRAHGEAGAAGGATVGRVTLQEALSCVGNVMVLTTSAGPIRITLCPRVAPVTTQKIEALVTAGTYSNAAFYRAEEDFVIQGGFQFAGGAGSSGETFPLEYMAPNKRGTVAMARTEDPNSGSGEFFINLRDSPNLDAVPGVDPNSPTAGFEAGFTVFGQVDEASMQVASQIAAGETHEEGSLHMLNTPLTFTATMEPSASTGGLPDAAAAGDAAAPAGDAFADAAPAGAGYAGDAAAAGAGYAA